MHEKSALVLTLLAFFAPTFALDTFLQKQSLLYGIASLTNNSNSVCRQQLNQLFNAVDIGHVWALKAIDSSGQPQSGFFWGNNFWLGSRSECLELMNRKPLEINHAKIIHASATPYDFPPFPVDFVMSYIQHNNTLQQHLQLPLEQLIQLGLCVPSSCTIQDIHALLDEYFKQKLLYFQKSNNLDLNIVQVKYMNDDSWLVLPETIILCLIIVATLILTVIGTIYDVICVQENNFLINNYKDNIRAYVVELDKTKINNNNNNANTDVKITKNKSNLGSILTCFSLYSNIKSLVNTNLGGEAIGAVHGFRFLSMIWVLVVHSIYFESDVIENRPFAIRYSEGFLYQLITNSTYCVDSFLFLSGFLLSYAYFKHQQKTMDRKSTLMQKLREFIGMFIHRYLRLTPVYLLTIIVADVIFSYYRANSLFYISEQSDQLCSKYWWRNLLYINNLFKRDEMCLSWSWYLSADTQFFVISTLIIIASTVAFKGTAIFIFSLLFGCMAVTGYQSYASGYIPTLDEQRAQLDLLYDLPWNRIGPHLIGVITGYILVVKLKGKLILRRRTLVLFWIIFPSINIWIIFTLYGRQLSIEFSAIYMGISRTLWSVGLAWLFTACCTGNAGIVNTFLSFRGWIPLGRISYATYLLHPLVVYILCLSSENAHNSSPASSVLMAFGSSLVAFTIAFVVSILFESPYVLLTKRLFKVKAKTIKSTENGNAT